MSGATLMDRVLAPHGLSVVFQPILQGGKPGWQMHAYEGLVRGPAGTNLEPADVLFEYARRKGEENRLDRACVSLILRSARVLPAQSRISVNVHASTLGRDCQFVTFVLKSLEAAEIAPSRLIIEIVEHSPYWDGEHFVRVLESLRAHGVHIALDDVGLGQSNYRMLLECRPDYLKVDRYLVAGSSTDFYRRAVLRSLTALAGSFGAYAVAEGIDNQQDLRTVLAEGFGMVQGFLLCRPLSPGMVRDVQLPFVSSTPGLDGSPQRHLSVVC
jgi:EAL domain-containing protein (putative c-di-GMP-specific phosphodiesterase class I)